MTESKQEMPDSLNAKVISSCKGCHFSSTIGKTQVDCELNKIERFKEAGAEIKDAEDGFEEFYIIDRFCSTYRDMTWGENVDDPETQVLKETSIPVNFMILHGKKATIDDLEVTLKDIASQSNKPVSVSVVVQDTSINTFDIRHRTHEYLDRTDIGFYIITMLDDKSSELEMIDEAFQKCVNGYYTVFRSGANVPHGFVKRINKAINIDLETVSMIYPKDDLNGLTVQCVVHKFLHGNDKLALQKKVEIFAEETDRTSFIKSWDEYYD